MKLEEAIDIGISDEDIVKLYEAKEIEDDDTSQFEAPTDPNIIVLRDLVAQICQNFTNTIRKEESEYWGEGVYSLKVPCPTIQLPEEVRDFSIRTNRIGHVLYSYVDIMFTKRLERLDSRFLMDADR